MNLFFENMKNIYGEKGEKWLANLPAIRDELSKYWGLKSILPVDNMSFHYVAKAMTQSDQPVVLKIGFDGRVTCDEFQALKYFDSKGSIPLIDYHEKYNALLLKQAIPGISLKSLYPLKIDWVMDAYAKTVKKLHSKKPMSTFHFLHIKDWLLAIDLIRNDQLPIDLLNEAKDIKKQLLNSISNETVLHGDLHLDNILEDNNEWISIDPKGIVGDSEFEMTAFDFIHPTEFNKPNLKQLFNDRMALLAKKSNSDFARIKNWVFVRLILSAVWSIEDKSDPTWAIQLARILV